MHVAMNRIDPVSWSDLPLVAGVPQKEIDGFRKDEIFMKCLDSYSMFTVYQRHEGLTNACPARSREARAQRRFMDFRPLNEPDDEYGKPVVITWEFKFLLSEDLEGEMKRLEFQSAK